jgi:hypothetical protein
MVASSHCLANERMAAIAGYLGGLVPKLVRHSCSIPYFFLHSSRDVEKRFRSSFPLVGSDISRTGIFALVLHLLQPLHTYSP